MRPLVAVTGATGVDTRQADLMQPEILPAALEDVDVAFYLVHSMMAGTTSPANQRGAWNDLHHCHPQSEDRRENGLHCGDSGRQGYDGPTSLKSSTVAELEASLGSPALMPNSVG